MCWHGLKNASSNAHIFPRHINWNWRFLQKKKKTFKCHLAKIYKSMRSSSRKFNMADLKFYLRFMLDICALVSSTLSLENVSDCVSSKISSAKVRYVFKMFYLQAVPDMHFSWHITFRITFVACIFKNVFPLFDFYNVPIIVYRPQFVFWRLTTEPGRHPKHFLANLLYYIRTISTAVFLLMLSIYYRQAWYDFGTINKLFSLIAVRGNVNILNHRAVVLSDKALLKYIFARFDKNLNTGWLFAKYKSHDKTK